ncbi:adaptin ear-binding coat-associated protein 1 NECAP-1, partial [Thamnocephalis sphaerospora]
VYRLPPRTRSGGHRAEEWGLDHPLWQGRLRVLAVGKRCFIRLEDTNTGELFAEGPYTPKGNTVEPTLDSSRYFVLRVEDAGKSTRDRCLPRRHAFLGIGFRERSDAFDLTATLQDVARQHDTTSATNANKPAKASPPSVDYTLKEGETISLSIKGVSGQR